MPTVAETIARRLREAGVGHLFGMPGGGSNLDLIEAAARTGIRFVLTATETAGALAAMAQAEISGRAGVCLTTLGPGAASAVNGVACALLDRAPVLVFTDSHPAGNPSEHQRLDQHALFAPVTKRSETITADTADRAIAEAIRHAISPPYGPVHLECPGDVLSMEDRSTKALPPPLANTSFEVRGDRSAEAFAPHEFVDRSLRELLERSRKPVLIAGLGARSSADASAIRGLCERRGVPAFVTYKAKGVVPDDHPWFAGVFTNGAIERELIDNADLIVGIGLDPVELIPRPWSFAAPVVSYAAWRMDDGHLPFAAQHVGPVFEALGDVESRLLRSSWSEETVVAARAAAWRRLAIPVAGFSAQQVVETAARRLSRIARVTVDAGAHMFAATTGWPVAEPNIMLISNGLSTMGFALPAAIGAATLEPDRPVVALTGDGGLLMCLAELATAVREQLRIIVIVFSDEALSLIDIKQRQRNLTSRGVEIGPISWPSIAEGFGAAAFRADAAASLDNAIARALDCAGPALIEARIDPGNYSSLLRTIRG
jgi:acetolactate synthase-1/2/3 large subunit